MSSIVLELQKEALDRSVPISDLLRRALIVAKKLSISEFEKWVNNELNGYEKGVDIPKYRMIWGSVEAWNPYYGWQPVVFRNAPELQKDISKRPCGQSIAEMEALIQQNKDGTSLHMPYPSEIEHKLRKSINFDTQVTLTLPSTAIVRIVDSVRTIILNWSLKLEEDGILGEGMSFTPVEKEKSGRASYNINNFYGSVQNPQIQQQTTGGVQVSATIEFDLDAVRDFLRELRAQITKLNLKEDSGKELEAEVRTVEAQVSSPKPKANVMRESLSSIRRILEGAGGSLAAQLILRLGLLYFGGPAV